MAMTAEVIGAPGSTSIGGGNPARTRHSAAHVGA